MAIRHFLILVAGFALAACGRSTHAAHAGPGPAKTPAAAETAQAPDGVCVLQPTAGNKTAGVVRFHEQDGVLIISASVSNLQPGSKHAFHIHTFGDLRSADGASAGGHFNPSGHAHGGPGSKQHHEGDLGNLSADGAGEAHYELRVAGLTIAAIVGRGVVVHAGEDDYTSQPAGNAGARIAVGVIGYAKSE